MEEHQIPQTPPTKPETPQEPAAPEITPEKTLFQNPPNLPPMEEDHKPIIFLIIIPIIIIVIGIVFFLKSAKQPTPTQSPKLTLVPTRKLGISTEWKEYQSSYGFTLKYPSTWQVYSSSWEEDGKSFSLKEDDEAIIRDDLYGVTISLKKPIDNPNNLSVGDWLKENLPVLSFVKTDDITVAEIKSIKATTLLGGKYIYIFIPYQGKIYQLVNHPFTTKNAYDYENIFNQILSTLTFTNKQPSDQNSNQTPL